jgi:nucleoside phosphorylase
MAPTISTLRYEDFTIGWICALPLEATAAMFMLDEIYESEFPRKHGQETAYHAGTANGQNIVIACLPKSEYGIGAAARVVAQLQLSFPNLEYGLMVGIGAGVPGPGHDIRLGDVIVGVPEGTSGGVVQYDLGKETVEGFRLKGWCNATDPALRSAISKIESQAAFKGSVFTRYLRKLDGDDPLKKRFQRPCFCPDLLHHSEKTDEIIARTERHHQDPEVHYGLIASGNKVIKNAQLRDDLREKHGIICFEMEAAGLMNALPVAVIRGVSDYADSHKNDEWQPYAAAAAAAYARGLLDVFGSVPSTTGTQQTVTEQKPVSTVPFLRDTKNFVGRNDLMASIEIGFRSQNRLVLVGLGGIGYVRLTTRFFGCCTDQE